jgi:hypothetical protein
VEVFKHGGFYMKKSLLFAVAFTAVVSSARPMTVPDWAGKGLGWARAKFSGLFAPSQQAVGETSFFGGANSARELQDRVSADSSRSIFSFWTQKPQDSLDAKLSEVRASKDLTDWNIEALKKNSQISDEVKAAELAQLASRKEDLSKVEQCYHEFNRDLDIANRLVGANAGEIDRVSQQGTSVSDRDLRIAKNVNDAMAAPYQRLGKCFKKIETSDRLVTPQIVSGQSLVQGKADRYIASSRLVNSRLAESAISIDRLIDSAKAATSDARDWTLNGWSSLGTQGEHVAQQLNAVDYLGKWETVRDWGVSSEYSPYTNYAIQGGKAVGGIALAAAGIYAAYKLGKLSLRAACALKRALWDGRSKWAKMALAVGLTGAVAAAPSSAIALSNYYGL